MEGIRDEPPEQAWVLFVCESAKQGGRVRKEDKIKRVRKQAHLPIPTEGIFLRRGLPTAAEAVSGLNSRA